MSEVETHLALEGDDLIVRRTQDAEPLVDWLKTQAEQSQAGADFHHAWSLPNVQVEEFYRQYCGDGHSIARPMDQEFWEWVHKKMKDPQYKKFWARDPANPGWLGYGAR